MTETSIDERCEQAHRVLQVYMQGKGMASHEWDVALGDLVADLLHLVEEQTGDSAESVVRRALMHVETEQAEREQG